MFYCCFIYFIILIIILATVSTLHHVSFLPTFSANNSLNLLSFISCYLLFLSAFFSLLSSPFLLFSLIFFPFFSFIYLFFYLFFHLLVEVVRVQSWWRMLACKKRYNNTASKKEKILKKMFFEWSRLYQVKQIRKVSTGQFRTFKNFCRDSIFTKTQYITKTNLETVYLPCPSHI